MTTRTDGPDWFHATAPDEATAATAGDGNADSNADSNANGNSGDGEAGGADVAPGGDDDGLLDADWAPRRRTNRLTVVLAVAVVAACTFTAGALVQRELGGSAGGAAAAGGAPSGFPGAPGASGFPGGGAGFPAGAGFPGGTAAGGTDQAGQGARTGQATGATGGTAAGTATAATAPVVVGTVRSVKGTTLLVENFAGTRVTVTVPATATVTAPGLGGVTAGMTVSVVGTKKSSTAVTATAVTARRGS